MKQRDVGGEIVAVTGAGSGLGACIAKRFSSAGDVLILLGRTEGHLRSVAAELANACAVYLLDVSQKAQVEEVFSQIYHDFGRIDRLVNCAGVGIYNLAENLSKEDVDAMIDTNLKGTIYATQAVLPRMKAADAGYLINVISLSGKRAVSTESVYCASKFGADGFAKAVALELAETNIRVSNFYMGNMATNLWRGTRAEEQDLFLRPEDVADIIYMNTRIRNRMLVTEVSIQNFLGSGHRGPNDYDAQTER